MTPATATLFLQVLGEAIENGVRDDWGRVVASDWSGWAGKVVAHAGQVGVVTVAPELLVAAGLSARDWAPVVHQAMQVAPTQVNPGQLRLGGVPDWRDADPVLLAYATSLANSGVPVTSWLAGWNEGIPAEYVTAVLGGAA